MEDPVIAADGHTYERQAIEHWFFNHSISPSTGKELQHRIVIPNHKIRQIIEEYNIPEN